MASKSFPRLTAATVASFEKFGFTVDEIQRFDSNLELVREGVEGNAETFNNTHTIELHHNYNGSGPQAFGGAKEWPVVSAKVGFQSNEYEKAQRFAIELAALIDKFFEGE